MSTTVRSAPSGRWAWAEIDLDAIGHNVEVLRRVSAPSSVWAVVKANAYGHGAVEVARTALAAGAEGLCVALVSEGIELRAAGMQAPILLLSQQPAELAPLIVEHRLTPTVYRRDGIDALVTAGAHDLPVHLKVDTGMQRVGATPSEAGELVALVRANAPALRIGGLFTHLATADDPSHPAADEQLDRFDALLGDLGDTAGVRVGVGDLLDRSDPDLDDTGVVIVHAANSAGALAHPRARRGIVRAGIAIYGISPGDGVGHLVGDLRPAMTLAARVSHVKRVAAGTGISYGLRHTFDRDTTVATIPIGYADGVPRRLSHTGGEVLVGGVRRPIVGVITMDQLMIDMGDDTVDVGDPAVLIGAQGLERIRVEEWAERLDTIGYEIVCGIGSRIERVARRSIVH